MTGCGDCARCHFYGAASVLGALLCLNEPKEQPVKKVFIYCGVSGSGKTTLVGKSHPFAFICSSDKFPGLYSPDLDPSKLGDAHAWCMRNFIDAVQSENIDEIVVDNTNTTIAELAPYAAVALAYGCELSIRTLWCDPVIAAARTQHGTPLEVVHAMHERLKARQLPPWWPSSDMPQAEGAA